MGWGNTSDGYKQNENEKGKEENGKEDLQKAYVCTDKHNSRPHIFNRLMSAQTNITPDPISASV